VVLTNTCELQFQSAGTGCTSSISCSQVLLHGFRLQQCLLVCPITAVS